MVTIASVDRWSRRHVSRLYMDSFIEYSMATMWYDALYDLSFVIEVDYKCEEIASVRRLMEMEQHYYKAGNCEWCEYETDTKQMIRCYEMSCGGDCDTCYNIDNCHDCRFICCDRHQLTVPYIGSVKHCTCVIMRAYSDAYFLSVANKYLPCLKRAGWIFVWPHIYPPPETTLSYEEELTLHYYQSHTHQKWNLA